MKLTYDPAYNIAYIQLKEKTPEVVSKQINDDVVLDLAPDGSIFGIELLNANEQFISEDKGNFILVNEKIGQERSVSFETLHTT